MALFFAQFHPYLNRIVARDVPTIYSALKVKCKWLCFHSTGSLFKGQNLFCHIEKK